MTIADMIERTGRQCGECSLCCKLLHVIELDKPGGQWCPHCRPGAGGCSIYETRPPICRGYYCGWMLSKNVGDEWQPLRAHMVLSYGRLNGIQCVTVTVDPAHPWAWTLDPYHAQLKRMAYHGLHVASAEKIALVQVRTVNRVWLVLPDRDVEITKANYVLKLVAAGQWDVELFDTEGEARERVEVLATVPSI
jgi:hypothetical protein